MIINFEKVSTYEAPPFANSGFLNKRYGFWGNVTDVDSKTNKVRVLASTGFEYMGIPVISKEWVNKSDDNFSGSRDLPPIGARVFVFMPTGTITGAFVLCSGYAEGDTDTHDLYEEDKQDERKTVTVNGWTKIEDVENSKISLTSKNEKVKLEFIPDGDDAVININAFNLTLSINEEGISIGGSNDISISSSKNIKVDAGSNNIQFKTSNFSVVDSSDSKVFEVTTISPPEPKPEPEVS